MQAFQTPATVVRTTEFIIEWASYQQAEDRALHMHEHIQYLLEQQMTMHELTDLLNHMVGIYSTDTAFTMWATRVIGLTIDEIGQW